MAEVFTVGMFVGTTGDDNLIEDHHPFCLSVTKFDDPEPCDCAQRRILDLEAALSEAIGSFESLADQQAMRDDWWMPERDRYLAVLNGDTDGR